jgi:glycosyltransferase involved in cell wall biosynthesis
MNVLFIASYDGLYGANQSLLQLILELKQKGVDPMVLLPSLESKSVSFHDNLKRNEICYITSFFYPAKGEKRWKSLIKILLNMLLYIVALWKLRNYHFDIVHTNTSVIDIGKVISRFKGSKHVWHLREFGDLDYKMYHPLGNYGQCQMYKGADAYIAISKRIYEHYKSYVNTNKMHLIYNGINNDVFIPSTHDNNVLNFCMAGYVFPTKNQFLAVQAIDILHKRGLSNFHLTILGDGKEEYLHLIKSFINENQIGTYVTMAGYCSNVPERLSHMDVGLMLSENEAFGRVTVEYEMSNLAVIASKSGANMEIIDDDKTGILLKDMNAKELADKMQYLIQNREEVNRISKNGRKDALNRFLSTQNSHAILELYHEILS